MVKVWKWVRIGAAILATGTIVVLIILLRRAKDAANSGGGSLTPDNSVGAIGGSLAGQATGIDINLDQLRDDNQGAVDIVAKLEDTNRRLANWIRSVSEDS
jgi:hypothetical protein